MDGKRKAVVRLTAEQREGLNDIVRNGHSSAKRITHARMLLLSDEDHPLGRYTDAQIAKQLSVHEKSVARTRKNFALVGEQAALERKKRETPPIPPKLDGAAEAQLVAICCSPAPEGRVRWTLQLLANELVERGIVASICQETVRGVLKKTSFSRGVWSVTALPKKTAPASSRKWKRCLMSMPSHQILMSR
jgi:hypothetical protein